jgi:sec-independent protein translocase protein TatA
MLNFFRNIGTTEIIIIGVIIVIFFGAKKIAGLGRAGGEAVKEVKKIKDEFKKPIEEIEKEEQEKENN